MICASLCPSPTPSVIVESTSTIFPRLLKAPAFVRSSPPSPPASPPENVRVDIHRQPLSVATEWQLYIQDLWKAPGTYEAFALKLKLSGLLDRCCFFTDNGEGLLRFRRLSAATVSFFGESWARSQIGRPHTEDPYTTYAMRIDAEYREAIQSGEPVYNRLVLSGLASPPVTYAHLLLGWSLPNGKCAVLACIDYQAALRS